MEVARAGVYSGDAGLRPWVSYRAVRMAAVLLRRLGLLGAVGLRRKPVPGGPCKRVRAQFPTRLETRTKESNVHASQTAIKLRGEDHSKSIKGPSGPRSALLGGLSGPLWSLSM